MDKPWGEMTAEEKVEAVAEKEPEEEARHMATKLPLDRVPDVDELINLPSGEVKRFGDLNAIDLRGAIDAAKADD